MTMNTCSIIRLFAVLWLLYSLNATASPTGPEIAQLINNRYQSTASTCAASKPAWQCNGVLVLANPRAAGQPFWAHNSDATALGAEGASYLRRDLGIRQLPVHHGVIFSDLFSAVGDGKTLSVLCAYPFTQPIDATRSNYGCAPASTFHPNLVDASSCSAIGVTDSDAWLTHFQQTGNQPTAQCSLSANDPRQFNASLKAHEGLDSEWSATANRLQVANWDSASPTSVPVQALYYDINQTGTLISAQHDQRDYFNATGDWLPILRMDLNDGSGNVFGFNLQDQLYTGYQIASAMNRRYSDTRSECANGLSAYFCGGILIRATQATSSFHAWDPSPNSVGRNGVSFSYLRADVGTTKTLGAAGFTMKESSAPALHPITLRCAYPANAGTSSIPDSCRASCDQEGVTTVAAWQSKYGASPSNSCAFTATSAQFQLSIQVRTVLSASDRASWNEIIIAAWPQGIPDQIPLEALFYASTATRPQAQFIQHDFFTQTARFLPVVRMTLGAADGTVFSYLPEDQLAEGAPGRRSLDPYSDEAASTTSD
ncbi:MULTISPECIES: hypothetical protein [unclassified Pseudomonas]|uniref:hypothetical protein n=1 Tax=unclassified Pseudomonas TaxID=196821 RepID=UPI000D34D960|nr:MULTISPECIES: hypothetical protein [unclassified Pseudomonas]RAU49284.1 hypothetical protein DBP26_000250 [Pseudomonas sp. RIT 409]RAU55975.1 hypothetical protein DBY65_002265 [Pseudomonas sp. RIT 412]